MASPISIYVGLYPQNHEIKKYPKTVEGVWIALCFRNFQNVKLMLDFVEA